VTCQELVELVTDYLDGALDDARRDQFEAHLNGCPACEQYVEQLRVTLRLAHDLAALERRPEVAALLDAFRDWHPAAGPTS
jgi:anti-sigma factor RsiW